MKQERRTLELVIALRELRRIVQEIQTPNLRQRLARAPVNLSRSEGRIEFLASSGTHADSEGTLLAWAFSSAHPLLASEWIQYLHQEPHRVLVGLGIGVGAQQGSLMGVVHLNPARSSCPLQTVRVVAPQMPVLPLMEAVGQAVRPQWVTADGLYSRLIGTVGLPAFARLQSARIAVIGAGGNGSLMAEQLARWMGSEGHLGLVDADTLERFNLSAWGRAGEMPPEAPLGKPKVDALAESLRLLPDAPHIEPLVASVRDWSALSALKEYEIFVCCVDNPAARFAATFLATLYLRPLLDVATGVFLGTQAEEHPMKFAQEITDGTANQGLFRYGRLPLALMQAGSRTMGADVRFTLPGSDPNGGGCLLCLGGVGDWEQVRRELAPVSAGQDKHVPLRRPFWEQRAGSSPLINGDAVNQGMRTLIAFLEGSLARSEHWQMDARLHQPPQWKRREYPAVSCALCGLVGSGDRGLGELGSLLHNEAIS